MIITWAYRKHTKQQSASLPTANTTRQAMNVQRNIEARSRNHCYRGKAIIITYLFVCVRASVCVYVGARARARARARACPYERVVLLIQHATRHHSHVRPLWLHHMFRHYLINGTIFGKKITEHKMCFDFLYKFYILQINHLVRGPCAVPDKTI